MGETGNAIYTCRDITTQLPLAMCFLYLFTDDREKAFLYHLSRLIKHFTTDTSMVLRLISWESGVLQRAPHV